MILFSIFCCCSYTTSAVRLAIASKYLFSERLVLAVNDTVKHICSLKDEEDDDTPHSLALTVYI